jgi:hypothetical protein
VQLGDWRFLQVREARDRLHLVHQQECLAFFLEVAGVVGKQRYQVRAQRVKSAYMFSKAKVNGRDLLLSFDLDAQRAEFYRKFANFWFISSFCEHSGIHESGNMDQERPVERRRH